MARILFSAMDPSHTLIVFLLFTLRAGAREKKLYSQDQQVIKSVDTNRKHFTNPKLRTTLTPQTFKNPLPSNPQTLKPSNPKLSKF